MSMDLSILYLKGSQVEISIFNILTDFNYATQISKRLLNVNFLCFDNVINAQLNWTALFAPCEFSHLNIS